MEKAKRRSRAELEVLRMSESGYRWPKPIRRSFYVYPVQLKMIERIAKDWHKTKREVVLDALQLYIGRYLEWKEDDDEK